MSNDHLGRHAGQEARRAGSDFVAPDLDRTIRRRRRARAVGAIGTSALAIVVAVGVGALLMRTEPDQLPADTTTTTTTIPADTTTTTAPPEVTTTTAAALPTEPVYGGVVTVASNIDLEFGYVDIDDTFRPATINPLLEPWNASDVARLTVPGAFRVDPGTGEAKPWVVNPVPSLSNGGVVVDGATATITYEINPNAVWADGTPVTFDDFLFTYQLIMSDDLPIDSGLRLLHEIVDGTTFTGAGKSVTFDLVSPDPRYERLFPWLVPAHAVDAETFADAWNDRLWLSGGPFVFDAYVPSTQSETEPGVIMLSRNDSYWETDDAGNQLPYLDGIEMRVFTPGNVMDATIATWFTTQSVDAMLGGVVSRYFVSSLGDPDEEGFVLAEYWDSLYEILAFETGDKRLEVNPDSLNRELAYRQAVLSAIDRTAVAAASGSSVTSIGGAASRLLEVTAWDQYDDPDQTDLRLAQLQESLGRDFASDPLAAHLTSSTGDGTIVIGEQIADQLEAVGVAVTTEFTWDFFSIYLPEGRNDLFTIRLFAGDGVAELAQMLSFLDPLRPDDEILFDWSSVGEPAQRFSDLMAEARVTLDSDRLRELLVEAETILADNAIVYPLVLRQLFYVPYWPDRVQGIVPHEGWDTATAAWWWSPVGGS